MERYALNLLFLGQFGGAFDHSNETGEILVSAAAVDEPLVELFGLGPHRRESADAARRVGGELQILEHQRGGEPAFIVMVGGGVRADSRDRAVSRHRPALARSLG